MAAIQCKICGGFIELTGGQTLTECRYCGNQVTLPQVTDENHAAAFNRGNHFRRIGEFDKALAVYERIIQEDEGNAEAHWCSALCRFGIEYVKDPTTGEYLPTCHRASYDSFLEDVDYLAALAHADDAARAHYQHDAEKIAQVQRGILAVSQTEKPFDVFLCYKETDESGQRTRDSQLAQDVYYQLTDQGMRVFFARITLEDKPGTQFEPYIFAALNTAKVMVVIGTKPEHLSATWVRNEWSRYLAIMKRDRSRLLIPCYRDMDPYDMPEQLSILQGYDMSRIGFIQDLVRGIRKVVGVEEKPAAVPQPAAAPQAAPAAPATEPLLRRVALFLEDGDWQSADAYCERVLDADPENARAYVGKLMAALHVTRQEKLKDQAQPFDRNPNYAKALRFADDALVAELRGMIAHICERNENTAKEAAYRKAEQALAAAKTEQDFIAAKKQFEALSSWKDAAARAKGCGDARMNMLYRQAEQALAAAKMEQDFIAAKKQFEALGSWKDAAQRAQNCETARKDWLYRQAERTLAEAKTEQGFTDAQRMFEKLGEYSDAPQRAKACATTWLDMIYRQAEQLLVAAKTEQDFFSARELFESLDGYRDAPERAMECVTARLDWLYRQAEQTLETAIAVQDFVNALKLFEVLDSWRDAPQQAEFCRQHILNIRAEQQARKKARIAFTHATRRHIIAAGRFHTVGLCTDADLAPAPHRKWWFGNQTASPRKCGTVVAVGNNNFGQCRVSGLKDIVAIAAGDYHTVGLRENGTVVAIGFSGTIKCDVSGWSDIVSIAAGANHIVGLRSDGSVVAVGDNTYCQRDVNGWTDIMAISAGKYHTVGLRSDGTVVAVGDNCNGQCNVSRWTDVMAIATCYNYTVGLRNNGTVVTSSFSHSVCEWTDIVAIAAGNYHTVGLQADGTVVAAGDDNDGQCNVRGWTDIVAIAAGSFHTVGLCADGTVVAVGNNDYGQCDVSSWLLKTVPRPTLPR